MCSPTRIIMHPQYCICEYGDFGRGERKKKGGKKQKRESSVFICNIFVVHMLLFSPLCQMETNIFCPNPPLIFRSKSQIRRDPTEEEENRE